MLCRLLMSLQNESQFSNTSKGYKKWNAGNLELHSSGLSAFAIASVWSSFYTLWPCYLSDFFSLWPPNSLVNHCSTAMALFCISKCVARLEIPVNWTEKTTSRWIERTFHLTLNRRKSKHNRRNSHKELEKHENINYLQTQTFWEDIKSWYKQGLRFYMFHWYV